MTTTPTTTVTGRTSLNPGEIVALWQADDVERVELVTEHTPGTSGPYTRAAYMEWSWLLTYADPAWTADGPRIRSRWVTLPELEDVARRELAAYLI